MSTATLDQFVAGPTIRGSIPASLSLPRLDSSLSLFISAPGIHYELEAPILGSPVIEDDRIAARFIVDDNVYLDLNLMGRSIESENKFKAGQFNLIYKIEEQRPRAHFVANTLMAVIGLIGSFDLKIFEPEVSTTLNFEQSLLEISRMLHRRQTAHRLMVIEKATGKRFLLPSAISEGEIERIAFVYHAIVDRSFIWSAVSFSSSIPATQENASLSAQLVQPFKWSMPVEPLIEDVLKQPIDLGRAVVTIEDAVIANPDEVREQMDAIDGREVTCEIHSQSGQAKYEFTETRYLSSASWEPKLQTLIDLEPYLDTAITERYHALAAATLSDLTEEEKKELTTFPEIDEAFMVDTDGN